MAKIKIGMGFIIGSMVIWLVDRFSSFVSSFLGRMLCGNHYMRPAENVIGDISCGFNADMYLVVFLFVIFLIGIIFVVIAKNSRINI